MNNIDKKNGIYRVDLSNGVASQRMEESKILGAIDAVDTPALMVATVEDAQHSPDIWAILPSGERTRVTHLNPQLDKYAFGVRQLISWRTSDGKEVQGVLALPADYTPGRRIPLIVSVYGGASFSEEINRFGVYAAAGIPQMFTTRGYAVLLPDCPVKPEAPMLGIAQAVLPGVDRVIEMGVADPERLGIMGMSYGGYSTLAILAQTNRFRAAVEEAGYADIVSVYGVLASNGEADKVAIQEDGQGLMRATPWENRAKYIENSPLFYLDRTSTPLLIIQGTLDRAVPPFLGDQIFVALTRLGREVEYAKFEGEEHGIESGPNVLERWDLIFNWFDSHLKSSD